MKLESWEVWFEGAVQGVGFRYNAVSLAAGRPIAGWIRNLSDGRVHMVVQGTREELKYFVDELCRTTRGRVDDFQIEKGKPTSDFDGFFVKH